MKLQTVTGVRGENTKAEIRATSTKGSIKMSVACARLMGVGKGDKVKVVLDIDEESATYNQLFLIVGDGSILGTAKKDGAGSLMFSDGGSWRLMKAERNADKIQVFNVEGGIKDEETGAYRPIEEGEKATMFKLDFVTEEEKMEKAPAGTAPKKPSKTNTNIELD